jgi:hypothetical protein
MSRLGEIKREANEWLRGNDVVELSESDHNWLLSRVEGLVDAGIPVVDFQIDRESSVLGFSIFGALREKLVLELTKAQK